MRKISRRSTKADKRTMQRGMRLTRPPRLEGKVKNAMMNPIRKKKRAPRAADTPQKPQSYSQQQRQSYHLRSSRH